MNFESKNELFDFRKVAAGRISIKTLKLINCTKERQQYVSRRDSGTNPLDYVFSMEPLTCLLDPGESCMVQLQYCPEFPFYTSVDYFRVSDSSGPYLQVQVKGTSIGPCVIPSAKKVIFTTTAARLTARKVIRLTNTSKMEALYQINIETKQSVFKPDKLFGTIAPTNYIFVEITFSPEAPGTYTKDLTIFVHYQKPVVIRLEGMCKRMETDILVSPAEDLSPPPLVLHTDHLDMGAGVVEGEQPCTQTVTVTNRSTTDIALTWDQDQEGNFFVSPGEAVVPGGQALPFAVSFRPQSRDLLFAVELEGRGLAAEDDGRALVVLHLTGHSFPAGSYGWMPRYRVCPQVVILPPCVPPATVATTFLVERLGHLPITFRFIPPEVTHMKVRPMQGMISDDFQIVVVELTPAAEEERGYLERWTLRFNGSRQHETVVDFRGFAEYPMLTVNETNEVHVPSTYLGSERAVSVPVRNMTRLCIRFTYDLCECGDLVDVLPRDGFISPNEIVHHKIVSRPKKVGIKSVSIKLKLVALLDSQTQTGVETASDVIIWTRGELLSLVAFPTHLNWGMALLDLPLSKSFRLFSFGACPVDFRLRCRALDAWSRSDDVTLDPACGTVEPDTPTEVVVTVRATAPGLQQNVVDYRSTDLEPWTSLVRLDYDGVTPTIRIQDLKSKSAGPLFTKVCLWKMMQIDALNKALGSGVANTTFEVAMKFPEAPVGTRPLTVSLYMKNCGSFPAEWKIRRKFGCSCVRVRRTLGQTRSDHGFHCPHRSLLTIRPTCGVLEPKKRAVLELVVSYGLEGCWDLCCNLEMSHNRQVLLKMAVVSHPATSAVLSTYVPPNLELASVFVGDPNPATQMYWLYNNSDRDAVYFIDTLPLRGLMMDEFDVPFLRVLNPRGVVKAKTAHAICFKFVPYAFKSYGVQLPINLGNKVTNDILTIHGDGVVYFESHVKFLHHKLPTYNITNMPEIPILISSDNLIIKPFPTNSRVERIIFMTNQKSQSYEYTWTEYNLENYLKVTVTPQQGRLAPNERQMCKIILESSGEPCIMTARIHLDLINAHDKYEHEKSLMLYQAMEKQMDGEFIITEHGYSIPTPDMKIYPLPTPLEAVLAIGCHIYSPIDADVKFNLKDTLKQMPSPQQCLNQTQNVCLLTKQEEKNLIVATLENIIWDIIHSKIFEKAIGEIKKESKPYYSELKTQSTYQEKQPKNLKVPNQLSTGILTDLAYQLIKEMHTSEFINKIDEAEQTEIPEQMEKDFEEEMHPTKKRKKIQVPFAW